MMQQKNVAPTTTVLRAPVTNPAPPPSVARALSADERFATFKSQGLSKVQQGELAEAARLFTAALELKPDDPETWNSLGVALVRQRRTAQGIEAFRRALRASPDHAGAHRNLAVALDSEGRPSAAVPHYRAFLHLAPDNDPARFDIRRRLAEISVSPSDE